MKLKLDFTGDVPMLIAVVAGAIFLGITAVSTAVELSGILLEWLK